MLYTDDDAKTEFSEQEEIIDLYCNKYASDKYYFNLDGIVNYEEWQKEDNAKICFFLKEAYRGKSNDYLDSYIYPLIKELNDYAPWRMWKKAAKWSYLIHNIASVSSTEDLAIDDTIQKEYIKKVAVIDIIKTIKNDNQRNEDQSIGNKNTSYNSLKKYMKEDSELLLKQLETIKPKFIICGYTFSLFIKLLMFKDKVIEKNEFLNNDFLGSNKKVDKYLENFEKIGDSIYYNIKYIIIDSYHLANFKNEQPSNEHIGFLKEYFDHTK